jgi:hypothetical protein
MKKAAYLLLSLVGIAVLGFILVNWYPYIFASKVDGVIYGVERVEAPMAFISTDNTKPANQVFSFAVAVKDSKSGEIFTASSEDRRWAVVQKGQCAEVKFLPYPPWSLSRSGAYFGARLIRLYECPAGMQATLPAAAPTVAPAAAAATAVPPTANPAAAPAGPTPAPIAVPIRH